LIEATEILKDVEGISFVRFDETDVVRHHLVQRIVRAYDDSKNRVPEGQMSLPMPNGLMNGNVVSSAPRTEPMLSTNPVSEMSSEENAEI
jgi:hypothetical protein